MSERWQDWVELENEVRARLGYQRGAVPGLQIEVQPGDGGAELYWLGGPNDGDPPLTPVLRYATRPCECGRERMYRRDGEYGSAEEARRGAAPQPRGHG